MLLLMGSFVFPAWAQERPTFDPTRVSEKTRNYWAFRPITNLAVPEIDAPQWQENPIDAFVYHRLAEAGLKPNAQATRRELIRRACYDLTGLPPTLQEVQAFEQDESPQAFAKVIDRMLNSPHYGEKWARHWLDLVRYAESNGYERDSVKQQAWGYRDYVIRSFNQDKPYDRFALEQIAGDELDDLTEDSIRATGYYRLGLWDDEPSDRQQARYDYLDSIVSTTGEVFMGLTVGCARCHDHKIDPVPQKDYYRMLAFFANISPHGKELANVVDLATIFGSRPIAGDADVLVPDARTGSSQWLYTFEKPNSKWSDPEFFTTGWRYGRAGFGKTDDPLAVIHTNWTGPEIWLRRDFEVRGDLERLTLSILQHGVAEVWINGTLVRELTHPLADYQNISLNEFLPLLKEGRNVVAVHCLKGDKSHYIDAALSTEEVRQAMVVAENGFHMTYVLSRGKAAVPGEEVGPGFLSVISRSQPEIVGREKTSGRRRAFAQWIVDPHHPLAARVMANRIWQYHFGRGIVRSSNNFGRLGDRPTHPMLMDWLAAEFIRRGWSMKSMHKLIMLSKTYRMSAKARVDAMAKDPANDLLWRFDMRRLSAEEIRDSILAASGKLNRKMFGPSIYPELPAEVIHTSSDGAVKWGVSPVDQIHRRSIYVFIRRSLQPPMLTTFDFADTDSSCAVRFSTTVATQALTMLNGKFISVQAEHFAGRVGRVAETPHDQVRCGLEIAMSRPATEEEVRRGIELLGRIQAEHGLDKKTAMERYCLLLLNLNEFLYVD